MEGLAGELCFLVSLPREHITSPGTIPRGVCHGTRQISKLISPSSGHKFPSRHPHVTLAELKHIRSAVGASRRWRPHSVLPPPSLRQTITALLSHYWSLFFCYLDRLALYFPAPFVGNKGAGKQGK